MITPHDAFILGYLPPVLGIYFNGAELFDKVANGATGELAQLVEEHIANFESRQSGVIDNVRVVESLVRKLGLSVGAPPRVPEEYLTWAGNLFEQAHVVLSAPEEAQASALHLLGYILGDAIQTQNLGVFLHQFLEKSPEDAWLLAQKQPLSESQAKINKQIELAVVLPALSEPTKEAARPALAILHEAPDIDGNQHATLVQQLQHAMRKLGEMSTAVEKTLR